MNTNLILDLVPAAEMEIIRPDLTPVKMELKRELYTAFQPIDRVYFLTSGVASLVNEPENGDVVEFALVGREGLVGFPVVLGASSVPSTAFMQAPGEALQMKSADLLRALPRTPKLQQFILRSTMALFNQVAQGTSCNRLHEAPSRTARWLLLNHDRAGSDTFFLTQDFMALMLGVQRPTVSVAASALQEAGLIKYARGKMTVLNRKGLEEAACPCYRLIKDEYDRLMCSEVVTS